MYATDEVRSQGDVGFTLRTLLLEFVAVAGEDEARDRPLDRVAAPDRCRERLAAEAIARLQCVQDVSGRRALKTSEELEAESSSPRSCAGSESRPSGSLGWDCPTRPGLWLVGGEFVGEAVAVGGEDDVGDFEGVAVLVVAGVEEFDDGDAGGDVEGVGFVGSGHAGGDVFAEGVEAVAAFFQPLVDPAGASFWLAEGALAGDVQGDVGVGELDGSVVGVVAVSAAEHVVSLGEVEAFGDPCGCGYGADVADFYSWGEALPLGFGAEGGDAFLAVAAGVAVVAEADHGAWGADEHAAAVLGFDEPFGEQDLDGLACGVACGAVGAGQLAL